MCIRDRCGDGIIIDSEKCDDGNSVSGDGCTSTCQIESGYTCTGAPSDCRNSITPPPVVTPPTNPSGGVPLYQTGKISINSNNVFITLGTNPTFTFNNPTEMQNFIKSSYTVSNPPTTYCAQRSSPELNLFDCLLIFPSGVPNQQFTAKFSYDYQGRRGNADVVVDPLAVANNARRSRFGG